MEKEPRASRLRVRYLILIDLLCIEASLLASFALRFETLTGIWTHLRPCWPLLLIIPGIRIPTYLKSRLSMRVWQYASLAELKLITVAGSSSSVLVLVTNFVVLPTLGLPYCTSVSVLVLESLLSTFCLGGTRLILRVLGERLATEQTSNLRLFVPTERRVLIAGAGDAGSMTLRQILRTPELGWKPVGFVDDDPAKRSLSIQRVPVLGPRGELPHIIKRFNVDEVVVAMPSAPAKVIDEIYHMSSAADVTTRVLPSTFDLLSGTLSVDQLRQLRQNSRYAPVVRRAGISDPPSIRSIMVTGGAGFIGANFVHYMLENYSDYNIVVFDKLTYAGNPDNLLGLGESFGDRYAFFKGDICDYGAVSEAMEKHRIDAIVNFAAESHVDRSLMDPDSFLHTNILGTYTLLKAARHFRIQRFHQVSTDEVYGQVMRGSFAEHDPLDTRSPYSGSKASADLLVNAFVASFDLPATITRGSNNIGPYQYPEKVLPLFVTSALEDQPLPVYGDGGYVRDYQYVLDHCRAIDLVLHGGVPGEAYNVGSGHEVCALDMARLILDMLGKPHSLIRLVADRPGQDRRYSLNCAKIHALGWKSHWNFEQALEETVAWYVDNEWWWRRLKNSGYWRYYERQYQERLARGTPIAPEVPQSPESDTNDPESVLAQVPSRASSAG